MHDILNFFDPNKDIPAHHENQLTRAFLVVLRISPQLIRCGCPKGTETYRGLPKNSVGTGLAQNPEKLVRPRQPAIF